MWRCLIFDFDDTLAATGVLHERAFLSTLQDVDLDHPFNYRDFRGIRSVDVFLKLGFSRLAAQRLCEIKQDTYRRLVSQELQAHPGASDLQMLKETYDLKLAIASNGSRPSILAALKHVSLRDIFDAVITADDVNSPKPSPEGIRKILSNFGMSPDDALMVDDAEEGIAAAKEARIASVALGFFHPFATYCGPSLQSVIDWIQTKY